MKKSICLLITALIFTFSAERSLASAEKHEIPLTQAQKEQRLQEIVKRVEEIKSMDKTKLTRQDKRELRKELKQMNKQARAITGGGVYLSVGAILLIILALIILL